MLWCVLTTGDQNLREKSLRIVIFLHSCWLKKREGELDQVLILGLSLLCDEVLSSTVAVYLKNRRLGSGAGKR